MVLIILLIIEKNGEILSTLNAHNSNVYLYRFNLVRCYIK